MIKVSVTEISRNFSDFINRVAYRGEHFTVLRGKKPVAEITPIPAGKTLADLQHILNSLPKLSAKEIQKFETDLDAIRDAANQETLGEPWAS